MNENLNNEESYGNEEELYQNNASNVNQPTNRTNKSKSTPIRNYIREPRNNKTNDKKNNNVTSGISKSPFLRHSPQNKGMRNDNKSPFRGNRINSKNLNLNQISSNKENEGEFSNSSNDNEFKFAEQNNNVTTMNKRRFLSRKILYNKKEPVNFLGKAKGMLILAKVASILAIVALGILLILIIFSLILAVANRFSHLFSAGEWLDDDIEEVEGALGSNEAKFNEKLMKYVEEYENCGEGLNEKLLLSTIFYTGNDDQIYDDEALSSFEDENIDNDEEEDSQYEDSTKKLKSLVKNMVDESGSSCTINIEKYDNYLKEDYIPKYMDYLIDDSENREESIERIVNEIHEQVTAYEFWSESENDCITITGDKQRVRLTHYQHQGSDNSLGGTIGLVQPYINDGIVYEDENGFLIWKGGNTARGKTYGNAGTDYLIVATATELLIGQYGFTRDENIRYFEYGDTFKLEVSFSSTQSSKIYDAIALDACGACMDWSITSNGRYAPSNRDDAAESNNMKIDIFTQPSFNPPDDYGYFIEGNTANDITSEGTTGENTDENITGATGTVSMPILNYTRISSYPGSHDGYDFAAPAGTPIYSIANGTVVRSEDLTYSYGRWVKIGHDLDNDGRYDYYTIYAHMTERMVEVGDNVVGGQQIGTVGSTGNSSGNHLHFEFRDANDKVVGATETVQLVEDIQNGTSIFGNASTSPTASDICAPGTLNGIRTTLPQRSNASDYEFYYSGAVNSTDECLVGQCVWYVRGRSYEIMVNSGIDRETAKSKLNSFSGHAKEMYANNIAAGAFNYSDDINQPKAGAIIVWGGTTHGHVATLEAVNGSGDNMTVTISETNWTSSDTRCPKESEQYGFHTETITMSQLAYRGGLSFVGYIYILG